MVSTEGIDEFGRTDLLSERREYRLERQAVGPFDASRGGVIAGLIPC